MHPFGQPVGNVAREHLGGRVGARERRFVVEIAVGQLGHHVVQLLGRTADVDQDPAVVEALAAKRRVDHEGRAVQPLGRPENLPLEAVRHHHVVADGYAEHGTSTVS